MDREKSFRLIYIPPNMDIPIFQTVNEAMTVINTQLAGGREGTWIVAEQVVRLTVGTVEPD